MEFTKVAKASEISPGQRKAFWVGGQKVMVSNVGGTFYAANDNCPHRECSLSEGQLEGKVVTCPCHYAKFDLETGEVLAAPQEEIAHALKLTGPLPVHQVKVEGGDVMVGMAIDIL